MLGKCLQHESSEIDLHRTKKEIFLVKVIDNILKMALHNVRIREDGNPIINIAFWCSDTIHIETAM